jgi:hypothetical protein
MKRWDAHIEGEVREALFRDREIELPVERGPVPQRWLR